MTRIPVAVKPKRKKKNFNSCIYCLKTISGHNISLHQFPKDPIIRQIWLLNCGFVEEDIASNRKLCSSHFDECFFIKERERRILSKYAVPLIFEEKRKTRKKRNHRKPNSLLPKTVDSSVFSINKCALTFMPESMIMLVEPISENPVLASSIQVTQTETISEMHIDYPDRIMWDISQSFPTLSEIIMPQMQFGDLGSSAWQMDPPFQSFAEE